MNLKNFEIENIFNLLQNVVTEQEIKDIKLKYRIAKILRMLGASFEDFSKLKNELIQKHGEKDDEGNLIRPTSAEGNEIPDQVRIQDQDAFRAEIMELMNEENDIAFDSGLDIDSLADAGVDLDIYQLSALEKLIDFSEGGE